MRILIAIHLFCATLFLYGCATVSPIHQYPQPISMDQLPPEIRSHLENQMSGWGVHPELKWEPDRYRKRYKIVGYYDTTTFLSNAMSEEQAAKITQEVRKRWGDRTERFSAMIGSTAVTVTTRDFIFAPNDVASEEP